jgi:hypothetical protein
MPRVKLQESFSTAEMESATALPFLKVSQSTALFRELT